MVIGAATSMVTAIITSTCTWVTSLVIRVMSDDAPNDATSWAENPVTRWNSSPRTSRPNDMATRAATRTAATAKNTCTTVTSSMRPPVRQM